MLYLFIVKFRNALVFFFLDLAAAVPYFVSPTLISRYSGPFLGV